MTKASDRVMTKVMGLLNLANDPNASEHERQLAAEHAERLMAQHMIDRMDLTAEEKSKIVQDVWDLHVGDAGNSHEFYGQLVSLMMTVVEHCGARVNRNPEYVKDENGYTNWDVRRFKVVGFPEDIGYAERIWFRVFKEFVSNVNPKWDVNAPLSENAYALVNAGFNWMQIVRQAHVAGDNRIPVPEYKSYDFEGKPIYHSTDDFVPGGRDLVKGVQILRAAYKDACARRDERYNYRKGSKLREASRNSFSNSFCSTIASRLRDMRRKASEEVSDADKFALALRDTKEQVDEEFYRLFPEFDPEVRRRMRETEEFEAACRWAALSEDEQAKVLKQQADEERRWQQRAARARRNFGYVREDHSYDDAAWQRGRRTAERVNLRDDGEVKEPSRKGIR